MASTLRRTGYPTRRQTKVNTSSDTSFSDCVQDNLFINPLQRPLNTFKPVVYLDEHGRKHGRVNDHLLQRQIENDRRKMKKKSIDKDSVSSSLYGIRNPNIAALIKDVHVDDDDDDKEQADDEVRFVEFKQTQVKTSKMNEKKMVHIRDKQPAKIEITPINSTRLESHLSELYDIDNVEGGDIESEDEDDLESIKPVDQSGLKYRGSKNRVTYTFSETPSTPKDDEGERPTNSSLDYNRASQDMYMPSSTEDVHEEEENPQETEVSNSRKSSAVVATQRQPTPSENRTEERQKSASTRPKSAPSTKSHDDDEDDDEDEDEDGSTSSRTSSSTSSDDTSALLRSDNNASASPSENDVDEDIDKAPAEATIESMNTSADVNDAMLAVDQENRTSQPILTARRRDIKGEYDVSQVIQLKESFQPVINEAASYGHLDIVRKLIERGQSVHTQNLLQRTPLHEACVSGNEQLVRELIDNGALVDQTDSQGMTSLHVAAYHGTLKCLRFLCENGCDINAQDDFGQTAAHYSAMRNHADTLKYLVNERHADLSIPNNESKLPIHYAAKHGARNTFTFLLQLNKQSTNAIDSHGNTIAHETSEHDQIDCAKLIWKIHRYLFKEKNHSGRTPVHTAALHGSTRVLHWLLDLNIIDIDQPDNQGFTSAHLAASRGQGECFACLLTHNAQLDVYTFDRHESVMDIARRSGKSVRIEQARSGTIRCHSCEEKLAKEKYDKAHALSTVEQLIHNQVQRGYHLNVPTNRSSISRQQLRPTT